jgi:precorrin-2 dehydrogenase / sirohydrochlorin ferrochelatase
MKTKKTKTPLYYPVFLNLQGKKCVVVGGGEVALRKVKTLLDCGADVTVISPVLHPDLGAYAAKKPLRLIQRSYKPGDLKGAVLVIAGTDNRKINLQVGEEAKMTGGLVNLVDDPGPSDFIVPSFFRKGELTLAVSTGGASPALARKIRTKLEEDYSGVYAGLLPLVGEVRARMKKKGLKADAETWQEALDLERLVPLVKAGKLKAAKTALLKKLKPRIKDNP